MLMQLIVRDHINRQITMNYDLIGIISQIRKGTAIDLSTFQNNVSSTQRLQQINKKKIIILGVFSLFISLLKLNYCKLSQAICLFVLQLVIIASSPFFTNYLIQDYLKQDKSLLLILIVFGYKIGKSIVGILCDITYQSIGYQYFAKMYWHILAKCQHLTGKILNIIEYDCNVLSNLGYAMLTLLFSFIQLCVILSLFIYYLRQSSHFYAFGLLIVVYIFSQGLVNYLTFQFNRRYLIQKDLRLSCNLNNNSIQQLVKQRQVQLIYNKRFLSLKILSKFIATAFPIMINLYVFVFSDRQQINGEEYILLILINMIRSPINQFLLTANLMVQIFYSLRRITKFDQREDQTEDGLLINQQQPESPAQDIEVGTEMNKERGLVNFQQILSYSFKQQNVNNFYWMLFGLVILLVLIGKCYNYYLTKHIISNNYSTSDFIGLGYQVIMPLVLYFILITINQQLSHSIFNKLSQSNTINCQFLNRVSGDITSIDRSITLSLYETITSLTFIISSYMYSILSLDAIPFQIGLVIFLAICLIVCFKVNRFIMLSRRQVARNELLLKAKIIKCLMKQQQIQTSEAMKQSWRGIFQCKQMGLFIENGFIFILNMVTLLFSLVLIFLSYYLDINQFDKSILLIACLNLDYDLLNMFLSVLRLEICLVSFQRVLNAIRSK